MDAHMDTLSTKEAAQYLGLKSYNTLEKWRMVGKGPRFIKIGGKILYPLQFLDEYLTVHTFKTTQQARIGQSLYLQYDQ